MSEFPIGALARAPGLLIRLTFSALRFKRRIRKSARKLRRSLVRNGMSRGKAKELAGKYEEGLSLRRLLKGSMGDSGLSLPFSFNF